jgi:hypothetical protein
MALVWPIPLLQTKSRQCHPLPSPVPFPFSLQIPLWFFHGGQM